MKNYFRSSSMGAKKGWETLESIKKHTTEVMNIISVVLETFVTYQTLMLLGRCSWPPYKAINTISDIQLTYQYSSLELILFHLSNTSLLQRIYCSHQSQTISLTHINSTTQNI